VDDVAAEIGPGAGAGAPPGAVRGPRTHADRGRAGRRARRAAARRTRPPPAHPSRSRTHLHLSLPWRRLFRVAVYDLAARSVVDLAHGIYEAGVSRFEWSGEAKAGGRAPAGVYFCRAEVNGRRLVCRRS